MDRLLIKSSVCSYFELEAYTETETETYIETEPSVDEENNPIEVNVKKFREVQVDKVRKKGLAVADDATYTVDRKNGTVDVDGVIIPITEEAYEQRDRVLTTFLTIVCPEDLIAPVASLLDTREVNPVTESTLRNSLFTDSADNVYAMTSFHCTDEFLATVTNKKVNPSKANGKFKKKEINEETGEVTVVTDTDKIAAADALLSTVSKATKTNKPSPSKIVFLQDIIEDDPRIDDLGLTSFIREPESQDLL
jgi:hypothetical protein